MHLRQVPDHSECDRSDVPKESKSLLSPPSPALSHSLCELGDREWDLIVETIFPARHVSRNTSAFSRCLSQIQHAFDNLRWKGNSHQSLANMSAVSVKRTHNMNICYSINAILIEWLMRIKLNIHNKFYLIFFSFSINLIIFDAKKIDVSQRQNVLGSLIQFYSVRRKVHTHFFSNLSLN